jgi:cysteine-rich repeat protein
MMLQASLVVLSLLLTLTPSLASAACGDGALDDAEHCDDGNSTDGDGCTVQCTIEAGYSCTGIPSVCTVACGDGIQDASEACDDGNTVDGDGCSAACTVEAGFGCHTAPVSAFFTRRGNSDCTTVGSLTSPVLPNTVAQALLSTPGRYRVQYVSGAISYYAGGSWLPGVLGVNFTSASGPIIVSLGINPPSGQSSRVSAMSAGFSLGLKRDFEAVSGPVLLGMVDTDCTSNNNSNTTITYRVDALSLCQQVPVITRTPEEGGPGYLFAGGAAAAATVEVYLDGGPTPVCTAVASAAGQWTCAAPGLVDGLYSAVASVALLGSTAASAPVSFTLDTLAPMAPSLTAPTQSGTVNAAPALSGLAEPGSQITVYEDATVLCTATALASGAWSCTPSQPLASGAHTMLATATDAAANASLPSAWRSFAVDAQAPAAPSLAAPQAGQTLAVNTPSLRGTAEPGSTVSVYVDGETAAACTAVAAESGSWSCAVSTVLPEGTHSFTATAVDAVGNTSPGASLTPFTVDSQPPDTFITSGPPALVTLGEVAFEFSSNEPVVGYECSLDTQSFTPCPASYSLAPGPHSLSVRAVDVAGNVDPSPAEYPWTVRLPHLSGGGCSAAPLPAAWMALLGLALLRRRALRMQELERSP